MIIVDFYRFARLRRIEDISGRNFGDQAKITLCFWQKYRGFPRVPAFYLSRVPSGDEVVPELPGGWRARTARWRRGRHEEARRDDEGDDDEAPRVAGTRRVVVVHACLASRNYWRSAVKTVILVRSYVSRCVFSAMESDCWRNWEYNVILALIYSSYFRPRGTIGEALKAGVFSAQK